MFSHKHPQLLPGEYDYFFSKARNEVFNGTVAAENVRASREKSGNQRLANLPTCYYIYVYFILCIQSCPILRGINILSSTVLSIEMDLSESGLIKVFIKGIGSDIFNEFCPLFILREPLKVSLSLLVH
jgi:hypothetical protein